MQQKGMMRLFFYVVLLFLCTARLQCADASGAGRIILRRSLSGGSVASRL